MRRTSNEGLRRGKKKNEDSVEMQTQDLQTRCKLKITQLQ